MREPKTKIVKLPFAIIAVISIGMGLLKIYTHYYSIFRSDVLDYIVGIGAIIGGLLVLTPKRSEIISVICLSFLAFEVYKAIIDFIDLQDVLLCVIAIICLIIPIIRYSSIRIR